MPSTFFSGRVFAGCATGGREGGESKTIPETKKKGQMCLNSPTCWPRDVTGPACGRISERGGESAKKEEERHSRDGRVEEDRGRERERERVRKGERLGWGEGRKDAKDQCYGETGRVEPENSRRILGAIRRNAIRERTAWSRSWI